jgi:hypothetical protein
MTTMSMPKTSVHQDYSTILGEDDVWPTGKFPCMKAVAHSARMQSSPNEHFRLGIFATDAAHVQPTLRPG